MNGNTDIFLHVVFFLFIFLGSVNHHSTKPKNQLSHNSKHSKVLLLKSNSAKNASHFRHFICETILSTDILPTSQIARKYTDLFPFLVLMLWKCLIQISIWSLTATHQAPYIFFLKLGNLTKAQNLSKFWNENFLTWFLNFW